MGRPKHTPKEFWTKVDKSGGPDACWPWTGARRKRGYGATSLDGKHYPAHRLAYRFIHGPIQSGLQVCHHCDNPPCCNPKHLFLGTHIDNAADRDRKQRQSKGAKHSAAVLPNRPRGTSHYEAKVTEDQVKEMRRLYLETKTLIRDIAPMFGLSFRATEKILRGKTWKHLGYVPPKLTKRAAKLSADMVRHIRHLRASTGIQIKALAHQFGVSVFTCNDIVYRRTWKDI